MKFRLLFLAISICVASCASAQGFFKPLPKPGSSFVAKLSIASDSTMSAWRPIVVAAAYAEPGNRLMAGAGFGYQFLKWNTADQRWVCQWSVNAIGFAGGSVIPTDPNQIVSMGIGLGVLNNTIMVGPLYTPGNGSGQQFGAFLSLGINFNN